MKLIKAALFLLISFLVFNSSMAHFSYSFPIKQTHVTIEKVYLQTDRDFYFVGDTIWFKVFLLSGRSLSLVSDLQNLYVELIDGKGVVAQKQILLCEYGQASGSITISDTSVTGPFVIRAYTDFQKNYGEDLFFHKTIRISESKNSFELESMQQAVEIQNPEIDVSFFPEGGFLLTGTQNLIAFKAVDQKGIGIPISGKVLNSHEEAVVFFRTVYKGMGRTSFSPEKGETYTVRIDGYPDFTFQFEDIRSEAMKLTMLEQNQEEVTLRILSNSIKPYRETYYVVCYSRDSLLFKKEIAYKGTMKLKVETKAMLGGINRFILLNKEYEPVSERLVFVDNIELNNLEIMTSQIEFDTRSPVLLKILDDKAISDYSYSNLSITVVKENSLVAGGENQHIASYLFLESELKGYIESPADYFVDDRYINSNYKLNLLMLTNGWRNYLNNLTEVNPDDLAYHRTVGITIKGNAERLVGKKPVVEGDITVGIIAESENIFVEDQTDSTGWFSVDNLVFFDTAMVFVQVLNQKGKQRTNVYLDGETENVPTISHQLLNTVRKISDIPLQQYRQKYDNDLDYREYIPEDGSNLLEEVEITAKKVEEDDGHFRMYVRADNVLEVTPSDYSYANVLQYLQGRVAGLVVGRNGVSIRGRLGPPLFILDGIPIPVEPLDLIESISMFNIDKVEILKGPSAAIYGSLGGNGVIVIYTKKGETPETLDNKLVGAINKKVTGFSSYREFYSPKYTPENINAPRPDHRTTLYWNPKFITKNGKATLSFYTADDPGYFRIIIEGVTDNGQICLGSAGFKVNSYQK